MKRIIVIGLTLALLTACSTAAQRQLALMQKVSIEAKKEMTTCFASVRNKPEYSEIIKKFSSSPTIAQLANKKYPTQDEKDLLVQYFDEARPCSQTGLEKLSSVAPDIAQASTDEIIQRDDATMRFIQGKVTWGTYCHDLLDIRQAGQKKQVEAANQLSRELAASDRAERARRAAAANAMSQVLMQQQMINNMNRPTVTNCNQGYYGSISCVSTGR